jgi:hypothetical protein
LIFELVYSSTLSRMTDIRSVADIVRRARSYNRAHDLSGVLVFDGERFCQHIEGDRDAVLLLAGKIAGDPRHQQFNILHQDFSGRARRFAEWQLAYALDSRGNIMEALLRARGVEVVSLLQQHLDSLVLLP